MLKEWLEKAGPEGKALVDAFRSSDPPTLPSGRTALPMRRALDALYDGAAWLAALCMVGLLVMVLLSIVSRLLASTCRAPTPTPAT
jgi:hypothetical protein